MCRYFVLHLVFLIGKVWSVAAAIDPVFRSFPHHVKTIFLFGNTPSSFSASVALYRAETVAEEAAGTSVASGAGTQPLGQTVQAQPMCLGVVEV